jgi:hypothetical protein
VEIAGDSAWKKQRWQEAMKTHIANLQSLEVYDLVRPPAGRKVIGARWVFAIKGEELPEKDQVFKARWVAKGFMQQYGRDYQITWSPTVRLFCLHILLSIAARDATQIEGFDIKDAYLRASLEEQIFVKAPPHFHQGKRASRERPSLQGALGCKRIHAAVGA